MIKVIEEEAPDYKSIKEIENHYFYIKEAFLDGYTHLLILEFESGVRYYFSIRSKNIKSLVESMESSLRREDVNRNQLPLRYDALKTQ